MRRQSDHMGTYRSALQTLIDAGLAYRCFRTRREVLEAMTSAPHGPGEGAEGTVFRGGPLAPEEEAARVAAGEAFAWRLSLDQARARLGGWSGLGFEEQSQGPNGEHGLQTAAPERLGDIVLARKDGGVAYHLAVTVDDALQGVTHVIRGDDLFEATHVQRLLQALLGLPTPAYRHHPLVLGPDGSRLAKRNGARSLADLRQAGVAAPRTADAARALARDLAGVALAGDA